VKVALEGGLPVGVHRVAIVVRLRAPYFPIEFQPNYYRFERNVTILAAKGGQRPAEVRRVHVQLHRRHEHDHDARGRHGRGRRPRATGFEILGEGTSRATRSPRRPWLDSWHALIEKYRLEPTNYGSWIDTRMWLGRDLTAQEGTEILARDIRLAAEMGFSFVRPEVRDHLARPGPAPHLDRGVGAHLDLAAKHNIVNLP